MPSPARLRVRFNQLLTQVGLSKDWFLIPLAAVIGALGGLVATGFDWLVEASGHFFFGTIGRQTFPLSEYLLLVMLPALGGLIVGIIQQWVARSGPTHGVPEVIEALARRQGQLPGSVGAYKAITSSVTIGSGGSAGVEGPIIAIGSVLGSVVGHWLRVSREHMSTLVGCGAAAGLAAIFNAPIAAVLFVLEVMLRDFSLRTFMPIVVASVFGTAIAQAVLGQNVAVFTIPEAMRGYEFAIGELGAYALLGVMCGLVGAVFTRSMRTSELLWAKVPGPKVLKPALGGGLLGVLGLGFVVGYGQIVPQYEPPPFFGNGYTVIESLLNPESYPAPRSGDAVTLLAPDDAAGAAGESEAAPAAPEPDFGAAHPGAADPSRTMPPRDTEATLGSIRERIAAEIHRLNPVASATVSVLLVALVLKLVGTSLTLGSGGSGGIIAPSLFMGATLGAALGMALQAIGLFPGASPATYALAGMAGVIAATVHCPLTAFLLVFEITQDYKVILPMMLVAILATTSGQFLVRGSVYADALRRRGIRVGSYADMTLLRRMLVTDVPLSPAVLVHPEEPAARLLELAEDYAVVDYVVVDTEDRYRGMVVGEDVRTTLVQREAIPLMIVGELMRTNLPTVTADDTLEAVLDKFSQHDVSSLAVVDGGERVRGLITRSRLMRTYQHALGQPG